MSGNGTDDQERVGFIERDRPTADANSTAVPRSAFESKGLEAVQPLMSGMAPNMWMGIVFIAWWVVVLVADGIAIGYWQKYKNEKCDKNLAMMVGVYGIMQIFQIMFILALIGLLVFVLGYAARHRMESMNSAMLGGVIALAVFLCCTALFIFCWLIVGSVWVYPTTGVQKPTDSKPTCPLALYTFAYWFVTAQWIGCGVCLIWYCITSIVMKPLTTPANQREA